MVHTFLRCLVLTLALSPVWAAQQNPDIPRQVLSIPRLDKPLTLEDFLEMKPAAGLAGQVAKVEGFIQRMPKDGEPATQRTEAYMAYDDKNLYTVFVCFDSEPNKVRANLSRRENVFSDDWVELTVDTFHDQRRGYLFLCNPLGIQADALWSEDRGGPDFSFDTLWHSRGKVTAQGYVVWMEIPLKSLRFPSVTEQKWGFTLLRTIPRNNEWAYWPRVSSRIEGRLNQAATLAGIENVSPGRNIQLIPYGVFRSFRALDTRDSNQPRFTSKRAEPDAGLDAKIVFKDSLVLDVAINPDFSQVESDSPQITVNQRFEVPFPEKRPFFLENADYFRTPIDLVFTRRIADPQLGVRATGKIGRNSIGALLIDDQSPGKAVPLEHSLSGERAYFGIFRVSRDIFKQSSVGLILTDREFQESFNRVGGFDGRFKLSNNWVTRFQAVASSTRFADGRQRSGSALEATLNRSGRQFAYDLRYGDRSPGFAALTGFIPQVDIRSINQFVTYRLRPEKKFLISLGPALVSNHIWDHRGTRLNAEYMPMFQAELKGQTFISVARSNHRERLRPEDFPILPANRDFSKAINLVFFNSNILSSLGVEGQYRSGNRINYGPPSGQEPFLANHREASLTLTVRPVTSLRVDNTYIGARLLDRSNGASIFNNHIIRSRANWQFNRELSLRAILQYSALLTNPSLTSLGTSRNFNSDFLFTYQVNAWTALYVGYNSNLRDIILASTDAGPRIVGNQDVFLNDGKQFFVKFSYLFRP